MLFSPQEYRKKLTTLIISLLMFTGVPIVIVGLILMSMVNAVPFARQISVLLVVVLSIYAVLRVTRRDMDAFKEVAVRRKRIERLNEALSSLFKTLPKGVNVTELIFVSTSSASITKIVGSNNYDLTINRGGGTVEYSIKPDGIRSLKQLMIKPDEVDSLIDEIEVQAIYNSARQHDVPILAGF